MAGAGLRAGDQRAASGGIAGARAVLEGVGHHRVGDGGWQAEDAQLPGGARPLERIARLHERHDKASETPIHAHPIAIGDGEVTWIGKGERGDELALLEAVE
jgi:hypothetical protein